jgi:hypothetical protein
MLYIAGETTEPSIPTTHLIEHIVQQQVVEIVRYLLVFPFFLDTLLFFTTFLSCNSSLASYDPYPSILFRYSTQGGIHPIL